MVTPIGARIGADQAARGMNDRALASCAGLSSGYMSRVRTGSVKRPGPDALIAIAECLGQDADEYLVLAGHAPTRQGGSTAEQLERLTAAVERLMALVEERLPADDTTPRRGRRA